MYIPSHFRVSERERLHDFVRRHSFGVLVTMVRDAAEKPSPFASHLPFLLDTNRGDGVLRCHMARANPQWRHFRPDEDVLAVFTGPHAFVSSNWYEQPAETVPTWNFTAVHATGIPRIVDDPAIVLELLSDMMSIFQPEGSPVALQSPDDKIRKLLGAIVAFEIDVARWEGKFKLSQNRTPEDRRRVREALATRGTPDDLATVALMQALEPTQS